ncbi:MAG: hypothetical protein QUU85_04965, partial [Candidatus Eisenbacteria bacterium]|nr:hypothetical protein [Candidatus Eisenbacteria bacterium]
MADPPRAPGSSGLDVPGLWILSDDPYLITTVATSVEGLGVQIRTLTELSEASGGEAAGSRASEADSSTIRPDWLLADLTLRSILPERLESFKRQVPSCQLFLVASAPDAPVPAALARLGVRHCCLLYTSDA